MRINKFYKYVIVILVVLISVGVTFFVLFVSVDKEKPRIDNQLNHHEPRLLYMYLS